MVPTARFREGLMWHRVCGLRCGVHLVRLPALRRPLRTACTPGPAASQVTDCSAKHSLGAPHAALHARSRARACEASPSCVRQLEPATNGLSGNVRCDGTSDFSSAFVAKSLRQPEKRASSSTVQSVSSPYQYYGLRAMRRHSDSTQYEE